MGLLAVVFLIVVVVAADTAAFLAGVCWAGPSCGRAFRPTRPGPA